MRYSVFVDRKKLFKYVYNIIATNNIGSFKHSLSEFITNKGLIPEYRGLISSLQIGIRITSLRAGSTSVITLFNNDIELYAFNFYYSSDDTGIKNNISDLQIEIVRFILFIKRSLFMAHIISRYNTSNVDIIFKASDYAIGVINSFPGKGLVNNNIAKLLDMTIHNSQYRAKNIKDILYVVSLPISKQIPYILSLSPDNTFKWSDSIIYILTKFFRIYTIMVNQRKYYLYKTGNCNAVVYDDKFSVVSFNNPVIQSIVTKLSIL